MEAEAESSYTDQLIDDLLPGELDWRGLVCSYPIPALVVSGLAGFFLGSRHGSAILDALTSFATREVDRNMSSLLGGEDGRSSD
ncbi:MAG: hypothetical protein GY719_28600 [bacterium]|nr:hypothetical protein [bacterium]